MSLHDKISKAYNNRKVSYVVIDEEFGNITADIEGIGRRIDCGFVEDYK